MLLENRVQRLLSLTWRAHSYACAKSFHVLFRFHPQAICRIGCCTSCRIVLIP